VTPPPALTLDLEARLLAPWLAACAAILGHAPRLIAGPGGPQLVFTADASDTYRRAVANIRVMPHARVRAHVQRLGYAWDPHGWVTTTPTPLSLRARLRTCGITTSGYTPELHPISSIYMSKRTWLERQCAGLVPVTVGTRAYYAQVAVWRRLPAPRRLHDHLRYHLHGVQHDMTRHALLLHLVPAEHVHDLGARVRAAVDAAPGPFIPEPLARFYENDLTNYCQAIWRDLADPAAFAPTFREPTNLAQLHAALDRRITESQRSLWHRLRDAPDHDPAYAIVQRPAMVSLRRAP
jgi:hypothetical protein